MTAETEKATRMTTDTEHDRPQEPGVTPARRQTAVAPATADDVSGLPQATAAGPPAEGTAAPPPGGLDAGEDSPKPLQCHTNVTLEHWHSQDSYLLTVTVGTSDGRIPGLSLRESLITDPIADAVAGALAGDPLRERWRRLDRERDAALDRVAKAGRELRRARAERELLLASEDPEGLGAKLVDAAALVSAAEAAVARAERELEALRPLEDQAFRAWSARVEAAGEEQGPRIIAEVKVRLRALEQEVGRVVEGYMPELLGLRQAVEGIRATDIDIAAHLGAQRLATGADPTDQTDTTHTPPGPAPGEGADTDASYFRAEAPGTPSPGPGPATTLEPVTV
jgi:hypothetical protein